MALQHLIFVVFICLVWGFTFVAGKASVVELPPIFFTGLRFLCLSLVLVPFLKPVRGYMRHIFLISLLMGSVHFSLFYGGMSLASNVSAVAVATQLAVPFSTILSIFFLGEYVGWRRWFGIAISFLGVVVISFDPAIIDERLGLLMVVGAALAGSIGMVIMKRITHTGVFQMQAWVATFSWPLLFIFSVMFEQNQMASLMNASWMAIGGIFYTALGASLVGHAGMYYLVQRYDVSLVSPLTLLAPVFGISFGVLLWGDEPGIRFWLGSVLTLFGVLVIALRRKEMPAVNANL
jgi:O-acetylserine/cysteine efflux transporter